MHEYRSRDLDKLDLLEQAGFGRRTADTPDRVAALKAVAPHQFVTRMSNGSFKYCMPTRSWATAAMSAANAPMTDTISR
jgi:hypothetical protein